MWWSLDGNDEENDDDENDNEASASADIFLSSSAVDWLERFIRNKKERRGLLNED